MASSIAADVSLVFPVVAVVPWSAALPSWSAGVRLGDEHFIVVTLPSALESVVAAVFRFAALPSSFAGPQHVHDELPVFALLPACVAKLVEVMASPWSAALVSPSAWNQHWDVLLIFTAVLATFVALLTEVVALSSHAA